MTKLRVSYDRNVQAIYVRLALKPYHHGQDLDDDRRVDYAEDGTPIGVEILGVDEGVNLDNLPQADTIAAALKSLGVRIFAKADGR